MVSTSKNGLNSETTTTVTSVKPEVMEFFQNHINPNMTPEQIEEVIHSLNPTNSQANSQPNPILGQIVNLLYVENGTNLVSIIIEDSNSGSIFTLSGDSDIDVEFPVIDTNNLNEFQFRLQEAFNYNSTVSISHRNGKIISLVIVNQVQLRVPELIDSTALNVNRPGRRPDCCFGPPHCPPKRF